MHQSKKNLIILVYEKKNGIRLCLYTNMWLYCIHLRNFNTNSQIYQTTKDSPLKVMSHNVLRFSRALCYRK